MKPKPTNKTKTREQETTKATVFCAQKHLRGGKLFISRFLKKIEIVLITSFTILQNYAVLTLPLLNFFCPSISIQKTLWPDRQDKRLLIPRTFKNAGSKPVRSRFHDCGTFASSKPVRGRFHSC